MLPLPTGGIAVEMKSEDGRLTDEQADWLGWFSECGWTVAVCRSADEARTALLTALRVPTDAVPALPS